MRVAMSFLLSKPARHSPTSTRPAVSGETHGHCKLNNYAAGIGFATWACWHAFMPTIIILQGLAVANASACRLNFSDASSFVDCARRQNVGALSAGRKSGNPRAVRAPLQRTLLRLFVAQRKLVEIHDLDPFLAADHGNEKRLTALIL